MKYTVMIEGRKKVEEYTMDTEAEAEDIAMCARIMNPSARVTVFARRGL